MNNDLNDYTTLISRYLGSIPEPKTKAEVEATRKLFISLNLPTLSLFSDNPFTVEAMNEKYHALRQNPDIKALKDLTNHTDRSVSQLAKKLIKDKFLEFNELYPDRKERLR